MATQVSFLTALGPNDPDDGEAGRQQRGMAIAAVVPIQKNRLGYQVPSQSGNGSYVLSVDDEPFCTCPDFEKRQERCKHVYAVEFTVQREDQSTDASRDDPERQTDDDTYDGGHSPQAQAVWKTLYDQPRCRYAVAERVAEI